MMPWRFRTYIKPSGRNDVQETIAGYDIHDRTRFERAVAHLAVSPKSQWHEPQAKKLTNEDPLYEIRYKAFNRSERALGYFDDTERVFVILLICHHKDRVYTPRDAFKIAHQRLEAIRDQSATTAPLQIHGEDFPPLEEQP